MRRITFAILIVLAFATGFACTALKQEPPPQAAALIQPVGATLLDGLGSYRAPFSPEKPEVRRWFDQGLNLAYGFNHDAAERSFLKAIEADPNCVMCWWGAALVLGPHVNAAMDPANNGKAWTRVQKAATLATSAGARERAYVRALSARYAALAEGTPQDRKPLDEAYAMAMEQLVRQFPGDLDAATLYAESLMNLQPWDYYDAQKGPKGNTAEFVGVLESVMQRNPDHPGALHLYIHAVEASSSPERGAVAADRLRELVPGSGHLVHMPAHIYTRVGRYHDAVVANQKAIVADNAYLAACTPAPGVYPLGYVPHNHHFLWWASSMQGDSATALAAAEETAKRAWIPDLIRVPDFAFLQDYWVTPLKARVQFGRWDEIAATPKPPDDMPYPVAIWHFAQGMAAVRQNRLDDAGKHLAVLAKTAADPAMEKLMVGPQHPLSGTLKVAERVLAGEVAAGKKDYAAAAGALRQAVASENSLAYFEPPLWYQPTRQSLGNVLLRASKPAEAEKVFREDLKENRANGWALFGLAQSLRAQKKIREAAKVEQELQHAWRHADIKLTAAVL
jgi:tetratricopeptide (TPR) repeat protein